MVNNRKVNNQRRSLTVLVLLLIFCLWGYWLQRRSLHSMRHTVTTQSLALERMKTDAARIESLRSTPQRATDRSKPNDELLSQIDNALRKSGIPKELWQDSIPQPPRREANSPYSKMSTRLYFEQITLQQIAAFAHSLLATDPTLSLTAVRISATRNEPVSDANSTKVQWNAELAVSYLVYAP